MMLYLKEYRRAGVGSGVEGEELQIRGDQRGPPERWDGK